MVKHWIKALRLRTLPLSLACVGMGSILAYLDGPFDITTAFLTLITTVFLQLLSNVANDYGDAQSGVDGADRSGPSRAVQTGVITPKAMFNAVVILAVLSFISGLSLIRYCLTLSPTFWIFLVLGILAIVASIKYTMGKNPYGYSGFGDIAVFIFFGLVGVLGTFYLHTKYIDWIYILPAMSCSFFAVAVLNINNIRDIESDKKNGKISIPVRLGRKKAVTYHCLLLIFGFTSSLCFVMLSYNAPWQFLFIVITPLLIKNARSVRRFQDAQKLDPFLKQMALTTLLFVITFGIGHILALG